MSSVDDGILSAEIIRRKIGGHGYCRAETFRLGRSTTLHRLTKLEGASNPSRAKWRTIRALA
jgi:hypothetical protein